MRLVMTASLFFAIASAFLLYSLNYDTRRLEAGVQAKERAADQARSDIAVLRAERSHLARPERIDPMARAQGLEPATARNYIALPASTVAAQVPNAPLRPSKAH